MIKLSERLQIIADFINDEEDIADIGTDHGYLPLYLIEKNPNRKAIFTDVNEGPLTKTRAIIRNEYPDITFNKINNNKIHAVSNSHEINSRQLYFDLRLGNGLEPIEVGEVHTVTIAGMGGILIRDILSFDMDKTLSIKKLILQPRTASDKLRKWLVEQNIYISDEELAYENGRVCEIIVCETNSEKNNDEFKDELDYEFSPIIINKGTDISKDWISKLIKKEELISNSITEKGNIESNKKLDSINSRLSKLKGIKSNF